MWRFFHRLASPKYFYDIAGKAAPWFLAAFLLSVAVGLWWGLVRAPVDYQQGDVYRIMFIHVPSAWMSMFVYFVIAILGAIGLIWRIKLADICAKASAPVGAGFTVIALATGAIWGKPTWGTWWVWDARLTSELILLFLYFAYIALGNAFDNPKTAAKARAVLALIGSVNLPIIHYSVDWWNTLHQGASVTKLDAPSIHPEMLWPLLVMAVSMQILYLALMLPGARTEILRHERRSRWVRAEIMSGVR